MIGFRLVSLVSNLQVNVSIEKRKSALKVESHVRAPKLAFLLSQLDLSGG
jgi:hypothetical protein